MNLKSSAIPDQVYCNIPGVLLYTRCTVIYQVYCYIAGSEVVTSVVGGEGGMGSLLYI